MKVGTLMDPNEVRRGNRAFRFNPTMGIVPLEGPEDADAEETVDGPAPINYDEPEPDDPDA